MFTRKAIIGLAAVGVAILVLVAVIATNLILGHRKKVEDDRIAGMVGDTTLQLRQALAGAPSGDGVKLIEEHLQSAKTSPSAAAASAAEQYLVGAREIARRRVDIARLEREAAAARNALAGHMARAERRNTNWIRDAAELKRRVEAKHAELGRSLKTLEDLLNNLPEAEKRLAPHVAAAALLEAGEIDAARKRAQDQSKRAAEELEQVRRIVP
jgi:hypothetical protein